MPGIRIDISTAEAQRASQLLRKELKSLGASAATDEKEFKRLEDRLHKKLGAEKAKETLDHLQKSLKNTRQETAKLKAQTGDYAGSLSTVSEGNEKAAASFTKLKIAAAAMFGVFAAQQIAKKALSAFATVDAGLIAVQKTTNMTRKEVLGLNEEIMKIAKTLPIGTGQLLEIAAAAGQLGVQGVDNITAFTDTLAKMQLASDVVGEEGAKSLARLLNVTGEATSEVSVLGSVIVALGNNMAATEKEILTLATEVGQATSVFAVSSKEAAGLAAAMKSIGVRAELGGSVVGRSMRTIEKALSSGGKSMQLLMKLTKMTESQLKTTFQTNATVVFQKWIEGIGEVIAGGQSASSVLGEFGLKGEEVLKVLPALASKSHILAKALNIVAKEEKNATALTKEAIAASQSFSSQMGITMNYVDQLATSLGRDLAPIVVDLSKEFRNWVDTNEGLIKQKIPAYVDKIKIAIGAVKGELDTLWQGFQALPDYVKGAGLVGAFLWGKAGMVVFAGSVHLIGAIETSMKGLAAVLKGEMSLSDYFSGGTNSLDRLKSKLDELKVMDPDALLAGAAGGMEGSAALFDKARAKAAKTTPAKGTKEGLPVVIEETNKALDSLKAKLEQSLFQQSILGADELHAAIAKIDWQVQQMVKDPKLDKGLIKQWAEAETTRVKSIAALKSQAKLEEALFKQKTLGLTDYQIKVQQIEADYRKMASAGGAAGFEIAEQFRSTELAVAAVNERVRQQIGLTSQNKKESDDFLKTQQTALDLEEKFQRVLDAEIFKKKISGMTAYEQSVARIRKEIELLAQKYPELEGLLDHIGEARIANLEMQDDVSSGWDNMNRAMADSFETGFANLFTDGIQDAGEAFKEFGRMIVDSFARSVAQMITEWLFFNTVVKGGQSTQVAGGLFGTAFKAIGGWFTGGAAGAATAAIDVPMPHKGWESVGNTSPPAYKTVNPSVFAGAKRFHDGLAGDEFPAILQKGETVIPKGGSAPGVSVNVVNQVGEADVEQSGPRFDGEKWVFDILLKAKRRGSPQARALLGV